MSNTFVTSVLYPIIVNDSAQVPVPTIVGGLILRMTIDPMQSPVPPIQSGSLVDSIHFLSYGPYIDLLQTPVPTVVNGSLVVTILYPTYGPYTELLQSPLPPILNGSLVVTIQYLNYVNGITFPDTMQMFVPTITAGSLT